MFNCCNNYLKNILKWEDGLPNLTAGSMFSDSSQPTNVSITPFADLQLNGTVEAKAAITPSSAANLPITWTAWRKDASGIYSAADGSDGNQTNKYVEINGSTITAKKIGKVIIRAQVGNVQDEVELNIIDPDIPTGISINKLADLEVGSKITASATVMPSTAKGTTTWSINKSDVATINESTGEITGVSKGSATITATRRYQPASGAEIIISATSDLKVVSQAVAVDSVSISPNTDFELYSPNDALADGTNTFKQLKAVISPSNATNQKVIWSSSDEKIAKVTSDGKVSSLNPGTAIITATADSNPAKSAKINVTVKELSVVLPEDIVVIGNETNNVVDPP
jgi:uncharacterized protein YjdB